MKFIYALAILLMAVSCNTANKNVSTAQVAGQRGVANVTFPTNVLRCYAEAYNRKRDDYASSAKPNHVQYNIRMDAGTGEIFTVYGSLEDGMYREHVSPRVTKDDLEIVPQNLYDFFEDRYKTRSYSDISDSATFTASGRFIQGQSQEALYIGDSAKIVFRYQDKEKVINSMASIDSYKALRPKLDRALKYCSERKVSGNSQNFEVNINF